MKKTGKLDWAFTGGRIPFESTGEEPMFNSHDKISVLNTSEDEAEIEIFIFYEDEAPVGTYEIKIKPRRLRKIRINDLIDPAAVRLERNYGCYIRSSVPVVIQFSQMNTGQKNNAIMGTLAFPAD
ncbi:sensory rhodopsin transducer [Salinimicrobium xinjiangense]|uniref:sensory rhodopsin transducer n=1 Tax=Salinimicrobium xinjiangense TaxID=438596 RepID=UPI000411080C|nr:sensory rhodopsin transducer [Salinimicrobium xinjiangense]